ncbi:MAG TPA: Ig-like domain-containing protein [Solirubrobacteraceae bacterium]|jgi:Ca2+-binding RTX toxin-like protein
MRRLLVTVPLLVVLLAIAAPGAFAASVAKSGTVITVTGTDASERIDVSFDAVEANYVFEDLDPSDVGFGAGCMEDDDDNQNAQCAAAGTTRFVVALGGNSDGVQFTLLDAQSVPATIDAGPGDDCGFVDVNGTTKADVIDGGDGEDCLWGLGAEDDIDGGPGADPLLKGGPDNDTIDGGPGGDGADAVDGGPGDDTIDGGDGVDAIYGAAGVDTIRGGAGNDLVYGNADGDHVFGGPDNDYLEGDEGVDDVHGDAGDDYLLADEPGDPDVLDGDDGLDEVDYSDRDPDQPVSITLDGQPNDGGQGEGDNVLDMEDLSGGRGDDTLRGSENSESSIITGASGNDTINPGSLEDVVFAGVGDDSVDTRDGFADRVSCGFGTDTVTVDSLDVLSGCENVTVEQRAPARDIPEDQPPTVAFTAPAQGAALATATTLTATAADDRGVARVLFVDEERIVCTDDAAPYTCPYQPRGEDVGRNTLTVVAVDTANQTGFSTRTVSVPRFRAALSIGVSPKTDRRVPFRFTTSGRLTLPAGVTPALGCKGTVTVQIKSGANTISTRRAKVDANCRYRSRVSFGVTRRLIGNRLTARATFGGNDVLVRRGSRRLRMSIRR